MHFFPRGDEKLQSVRTGVLAEAITEASRAGIQEQLWWNTAATVLWPPGRGFSKGVDRRPEAADGEMHE